MRRLCLKTIPQKSLAAGGMSASILKGWPGQCTVAAVIDLGDTKSSDAGRQDFEMFYCSLRAQSPFTTLMLSLQAR